MCVGVETIYRASLSEVAAVRTERNLAQRLYPQRFARTEVAMAQVAFWIAILTLVCSSAVPDVSATLTEEEKEELLRAHNHYRGLVDPLATNMIRLVCSCRKN